MAHKTPRNVCLLDHWFVIKGYNSGMARGKRHWGRDMGKGYRASMPSPGVVGFPRSPCVPQPGCFPFAFLWKHHYIGMTDWIIVRWWLSAPFPGPLPFLEVSWKFQPFDHMVGSSGGQPTSWWWSRAFPKSPHWHNQRHLYGAYCLGSSRGFRYTVPEMGMKTKYIFL